jgi:hypothetical protein
MVALTFLLVETVCDGQSTTQKTRSIKESIREAGSLISSYLSTDEGAHIITKWRVFVLRSRLQLLVQFRLRCSASLGSRAPSPALSAKRERLHVSHPTSNRLRISRRPRHQRGLTAGAGREYETKSYRSENVSLPTPPCMPAAHPTALLLFSRAKLMVSKPGPAMRIHLLPSSSE